MPIVVSDTSCMIDLKEAGLLEAMLRLPYVVVMPDVLFEDEWLCLTGPEKQTLCDLGLDVRILSGPLVQRAGLYFNRHRMLQLGDCFSLVLAEEISGSIFLCDGGPLRAIAESNGMTVRSGRWISDQLGTRSV